MVSNFFEWLQSFCDFWNCDYIFSQDMDFDSIRQLGYSALLYQDFVTSLW